MNRTCSVFDVLLQSCGREMSLRRKSWRGEYHGTGSTTRIPAPVTGYNRTLKRMEGFMNSKGLADASLEKAMPQGIYTRISTRKCNSKAHSLSSSSQRRTDKFSCSTCSRKMLCLCLNCVNHKTRFFDRRDVQKMKEQTKRCFAREIEKFLASDISLEGMLHSTRESIEYLKQDIIDKKKAIMKKKAALSVIRSRDERYRKIIEELKERCRRHQKVIYGPPSTLEASFSVYQDKVQRLVKFNAQWFFKIFHIHELVKPKQVIDDSKKCCQKVIAEACQEELAASTDKAWALLAPMEYSTASEPFCSMCSCNAPDRGQYKILKEWLSTGIPTAPEARPVHNMFAALVYAIQLVNLLTVHFDVCLPEQISFQEFSLCRKWTKGLFDTDIFKLNHAIVVLCLSLGVKSKLIEPHRPFVNLLLLSNIVNEPDSHLKPEHHAITNELAAVLNDDLRQMCWAEREKLEESGWYIVRYSDNFYDETYDKSVRLGSAHPSLSDLDEMLRDFSAFASPLRRLSEHDFRCMPNDTGRQHSPEFLPRVLSMFRNFSTK